VSARSVAVGPATCGSRWCSSCRSVHWMENRRTASTATLRATVAAPATSMMKARLGLNGIRHRWRQSSDGVDLRQV